MCFRGMRETDVFIPPKNKLFSARIYLRSLPYGGITHIRFKGTGPKDPSQPIGAPSGFVLIK